MSEKLSVKEGCLGTVMVAILIAFVVTLGAAATGWPLKKAPADKIALSYGGGPFEGAKFQKVVNPGSGLVFNGWYDKWYEYPITQRSYIISKNPDEGDVGRADFISAPSSDGVNIEWELSVYFKLNTSIIRQFHETVGLKYKAWEHDGWDKMLHEVFRQQLEAAMQTASRKHSATDYQTSADAISSVRNEIAQGLKDNINTVLGNPFFCGPSFDRTKADICSDFEVVVKKPTLPKSVVDSLEQKKASEIAIDTAKNKALAAKEEANGQALAQKALSGIYSDPNYVEYLRAKAMEACASNSNCTLVVTPATTGVNINTK